ncbi:MAG: tRNA (adenosine(37)-N6)-threonylcarbamoyltransferase complex dimerization subunit type 1 TsaB [Chitinophagales bacterium]|nr:tRNA (adenosine(37)-N6)-threonylcarbamoyltransferase complex dimerization subunit type 1 TsaB [Chitinophagales bacterium]
MANLLLIETSTGICSIGVSQGNQLLALRQTEEAYQHASRITLLIQSVMESAPFSLNELDGVVLSSGPGSYTSLRVGAATAKGICYSLDKPLIVVDTLQALALAALKSTREEALYYPMIDARRMEVYTAGYDATNECIAERSSIIVDENTFSEQLSKGHQIVLCGDGAEKCKKVLPKEHIIYTDVTCSAAHLLPFALIQYAKEDFEDIAYFSPIYLKPPNITKSKKRLL